jgi:hypothetical protein
VLRQPDRDAVVGCDGQQLFDLVPGRRRSLLAELNRLADLHEHLFQARRSNGNKHAGRFVHAVLEAVQAPDRHVGKERTVFGAGLGANLLLMM